MRLSIRCCIRFWALMPRIFLTHTDATRKANVLSISPAIIAIAHIRSSRKDAGTTPDGSCSPTCCDAMSMAFFIAHTEARLTTVSSSPMTVFRTACRRLSADERHSHRSMLRMGMFVCKLLIFTISGQRPTPFSRAGQRNTSVLRTLLSAPRREPCVSSQPSRHRGWWTVRPQRQGKSGFGSPLSA